MQATKQTLKICQRLAKASKELKHYYQEKDSFETDWVAELRLNSRTDPYELVNSLTGTPDHVEKKFATRICVLYSKICRGQHWLQQKLQ